MESENSCDKASSEDCGGDEGSAGEAANEGRVMALNLKALQAAATPEDEAAFVAGCEFWRPIETAILKDGEIIGTGLMVKLPNGKTAGRVFLFEDHAESLVEKLAKRFGRFVAGGRD